MKTKQSTGGLLAHNDWARRDVKWFFGSAQVVLFVLVVVFAAMMALSAMGVEIGPLIAGLGVLGVAIGFGAQSLVRDVIAGMFYLLILFTVVVSGMLFAMAGPVKRMLAASEPALPEARVAD